MLKEIQAAAPSALFVLSFRCDQDDWTNDFPTSRKWVKSGSLRADARGRALRGKREEEILWGGTRARRRL